LSSADHRYGQPRLVDTPRGRFVVYVHDHVRPTIVQPFDDHERVILVVSDVREHSDVLRDAAQQTGLMPEAVGPDWLLVQ
jgi:hypothetical protein